VRTSPAILVVDDEHEIRTLLSRMITAWGYQTTVASSAAEAQDALQKSCFDLVLTDIRMPKMDGMQLLAWIKDTCPETDVIVMTAYASIETAATAVRLGAFDYLMKPFGQLELVRSCIHRAIEQRRLAAALQTSTENFDAIVENSAEGTLVTTETGHVLYTNPAAMHLFGRSRNDLQEALMGHVIFAGEMMEIEIHRKDAPVAVAEMRIMDTIWRGQPACLILLREITGRKRAESALDEERERLDAMLRSIGDAVLMTDREGFVVLMNPAAQKIAPWSQQEVIGEYLSTALKEAEARSHPEQRNQEGVITSVLKLLSAEEREARLVRMIEGVPYQILASHVHGESGEFTGLVLSLRNVLAEETLKQKLRELSKLKSQFIHNVSHELRTPLSALIGFARLLSDDSALTSSQRHDVDRILARGQTLLGLIEDLLDLSKIEAGQLHLEPEHFRFEQVLEDATAQISSAAAERGLRLDTMVEPEIGPLFTDRRKLTQVLINLLSNACKFTDVGGISVLAQREGDTLKIQVRDTGIGIPAAELQTIFDEFHQVDGGPTRKAGGTGLGLTIVRRFCSLLGGTVEVKSQPGCWTDFSVRIPVSVQQVATGARDEP